MIGNALMLSKLEDPHQGKVTFGDKKNGRVIKVGKVDKHPFCLVENVYLVDDRKAKLLSSSRLCNKGKKVTSNSVERDASTLKID